jgi:hypothetical protein
MDKEWKNKVAGLSVFEQWKALYHRNKPKQIDGRSIWGPGVVYKNSKKLVELLPGILKELKIKTFSDIGCADFLWLSQLDWSEIKYTGYDIVEEIIDENKKNFPGYDFKYINLIEDECPGSDMIFIRSVFIHTTLDDIKKMITNIKNSGSKYLMASTLPYIEENKDTSCIWLVKRNLEIAPFNFPEPLYLVPEMDRDDINNYMGVWKIDDLN